MTMTNAWFINSGAITLWGNKDMMKKGTNSKKFNIDSLPCKAIPVFNSNYFFKKRLSSVNKVKTQNHDKK